MAVKTIGGFASGATVRAYTRTSQLPSSSLSPPVPSGTAVETETAGSDGRVTFSLLADGTDYVASDGSRVVSFTTDVPSGTSVLHNGTPVVNPNFIDPAAADLVALGLAYGWTPTSTVITANHTAGLSEVTLCDATAGSFTLTAPGNSAVQGALFGAALIATSGTNTVTVQLGPGDVFDFPGGPTSKTLKVAGQRILCQYLPAIGVWRVLMHGISLDAADARYAAIGSTGGGGVGADPWAAGPSGATMPRGMAINAAIPLTSGVMLFTGGLAAGYGVIPAGKTATHATVISGTTAGAGITHAWVALYRKDTGALLTASNDLPTAVAGGAWAANTAVVFDFATPQTPASDLPVRVGVMVAATTPPSLTGSNLPGKVSGLSPVAAATTGTGLTTPATAPATIAEPTPGTGAPAAAVWLT